MSGGRTAAAADESSKSGVYGADASLATVRTPSLLSASTRGRSRAKTRTHTHAASTPWQGSRVGVHGRAASACDVLRGGEQRTDVRTDRRVRQRTLSGAEESLSDSGSGDTSLHCTRRYSRTPPWASRTDGRPRTHLEPRLHRMGTFKVACLSHATRARWAGQARQARAHQARARQIQMRRNLRVGASPLSLRLLPGRDALVSPRLASRGAEFQSSRSPKSKQSKRGRLTRPAAALRAATRETHH